MTSKRDKAVGYFVATARDEGKAILERGSGERVRFISAIKDGNVFDVTICHWGMPAVEKRLQLNKLADAVYQSNVL